MYRGIFSFKKSSEDDGVYRCFARRSSDYHGSQSVYIETEVIYRVNDNFSGNGCGGGGTLGNGGGGTFLPCSGK